MSSLSEYAERFSCARMERRNGVLVVTFHTDGGSMVWSRATHREIPQLFAEIGGDFENRVVILTGTGDDFCVRGTPFLVPGPETVPRPGFEEGGIPADVWNVTYTEGKRLLGALLDIDVPVISVVNGPAHAHAELLLLSDIILAAPHASFCDHHMEYGLVAGDGVHIVWPLVFGSNRGRYLLLTSGIVSAEEAHEIGVVNEIVSPETALQRAHEIAGRLVAMSPLITRFSRVAMTSDLRRRIHQDLGYGLALEGLAVSAGRGQWDTSTPIISQL